MSAVTASAGISTRTFRIVASAWLHAQAVSFAAVAAARDRTIPAPAVAAGSFARNLRSARGGSVFRAVRRERSHATASAWTSRLTILIAGLAITHVRTEATASLANVRQTCVLHCRPFVRLPGDASIRAQIERTAETALRVVPTVPARRGNVCV